MEIVKQFLRDENARAKFTIEFNGNRYPPIECLIKFLFIQFGTTSLRGYLFMPDYTVTTDGKSTITFTHIKNKQSKITLIASCDNDIGLWYQFAQNSTTTLNSFLEIISDCDLACEQNLGIPKHEYILKITSDMLFTLVDSEKCIINYQISSRTTVTLSNFNEEPRIGLYDFNPNKITWMTIPDLDGIFRWTLLLKCCTLIASKKEDEQFKSLELQDITEEVNMKRLKNHSTSVQKDDPDANKIIANEQKENETNLKLTEDPKEEKKPEFEATESKSETQKTDSDTNNVPTFSPTTTFPKHTLHTIRKNSNEKDLQDLGSPRNRRLSCDAHSLNKFSLKVKKQMDQLMTKRNSYRKTINIPEPIPEPQIEPPVLINYSRISSQNKPYVIVERQPSKKMTNEDLMKIIEPRIEHPLVNFNRYVPNYVFYNFRMPHVDYIPEDNYHENFKSLLFRSIGITTKSSIIPDIPETFLQKDPKMTFLMISSIVANGFRGQSIADFYKIPKQSNMMYDVLSILRKYKKNIFDFMLSIKEEDLKVVYAPWSILRRDRSFIEELNNKFVKSQIDDSTIQNGDFIGPLIKFEPTFPMPESVPFQFALKPFEFIQKFLFDVMYFQRINSVNPRVFITSLSKMIYSLFSHYLVFEVDESQFSLSNDQSGFNSNSSSSFFVTNPITVTSIITSTITLQVFIKEVLSKVKPLKKTFPPWSYLTFQQDFQQSWIYFWASCFQEGKLAESFSEFFKYPELLKKYYYPCSSMRNCECINYITEILNVISQINLSTEFEINSLTSFGFLTPSSSSAYSVAATTTATGTSPAAAISNAINDNKILKNIAGFIGLH